MVRISGDKTGLILKSVAILLLYVDTTLSGKSKKHHHTAAPAMDSAKLNDMMAGGGYPGDNLPPSAGGYGSPDGLPPNYPDMPPQPPKANMNDLLAGLMTTTSINFGDLGGAGLGDLPAGLDETTLDLNANIALLNQMNLATDPPATAALAPAVQAMPNLVNIPFMPNYFVDPNLLAAYQNPFGVFNPVLPNPYMVPNFPPNIPINFVLGNTISPNYQNNNNNYGPLNQNGYNPGQNSANNFNNNNNNFGQNGPNCFNNNNNAPCNSNNNGNNNANFNSNSNGNNQNRIGFGSNFNNYGNCGQNNFGGSNNNPSNNQNGNNYNPQTNNNNFEQNNQNMNSNNNLNNNNLNDGNFIQNNQNGIAGSNNGVNIQNNQNSNNQGSNNQMVNSNGQNMNFDNNNNNNNNNLNNLNQDMVTNLYQNTNNNGNNIPGYSNQNSNNPQTNNYGSNNNFVPINSNNYNQNSNNNNNNNQNSNLNPYNNNPNNNNNNGLQNSNNLQNNNFPGDNNFLNNNPNKMGNVDNNFPNRDSFQANNQMVNENGPDFQNGNGLSNGAATKVVPNNANYPDANIQSGNRNGINNPGDLNNNPNFKNYPDYGAKFSNNFQSADTFQQTEQTVSNTNFLPNYDTDPYNGPKDPVPDELHSNLTYNGQGDNVDPYNPANNQLNQNMDVPTGNPNKVMYPDYHQNMGDANKLNQYPQNDVPPTNMDYGNLYSKNNTLGPMYGDISPQPLSAKESNIPKNYMMSEEAVSVTPDLKTYDSVDGWKKETTANKDSSQSKERKHLKGKRHKKKRKKMLDDLFGGDDSQHSKPKSESHIARKSSFEDPYKSNDEVHPKKDSPSKEFKSASQFDDLSKDQLMKDKNKIDALLKDKYYDNSGTDISTTSKPSLWNKLANGGSWLLNGVPKLKNVLVNDFKYYITDLDS